MSDANVSLDVPLSATSKCALCLLEDFNPNDPFLVELWMAYAPGSRRPWAEVERILARSGSTVSLAEVRLHFRTCRPEQPNPPLRLANACADEIFDQLSPRDWQLIRFVSQGWHVREEHVRAWFFEANAKNLGSARSNASERLAVLRHHGVLYRVHLKSAPKRGDSRVVYGLGRTGAKLLDLQASGSGRSHRYLKRKEDVSTYRLKHDLGVLDVALELHRSGAKGIELMGERCTAEVKAHNLHTSRSLSFDYATPQYASEFGGLVAPAHHTMVSDGFGVIGIRPDGAPEKAIACPYLLEFDTGRRKKDEVADQLFAYLGLDNSRSVQKRFPALNVEGYQVPLIMVTSAPEGTPGAGRRTNLIKALNERVQKRRYPLDPKHPTPIYIALRQEVTSLGLDAPVVSTWDNKQRSLVEAVADHARPLIHAKRITRDSVLGINLEAARARSGVKEGLTATERAEAEADRVSSYAAIEAQQRQHERYEAERLRQLKELQDGLTAGGQS